MSYIELIWDLEDDPRGNVAHISEHDLSKEDVEFVMCHPVKTGTSRSSGRSMTYEYTEWGAYVAVVYEVVDDDVVYPVTAFELEED